MELQDETLRKKILSLEQRLEHSVYHGNAFEQIALKKEIDIARSTLLNIK